MLRSRRVVLSALVLSAACAPAVEPPPVPPPAPPPPPPPGMTSAAPAASSSASAATKYEGHGLASVPKEVLAKYRPRTLAPEVSRRIQAMLDLRPPTAGRLSSDGKHLFFNWSITGVSQIFRLDGPGGFPTQVTGGEDGAIAVGITPDGANLVVSRDRKGEENPGLYLQDAKKAGALTKIQHEAGVQTRFEAISKDSKWIYFSSNDRKKDSYVIYRWSIESKTREVVFDQEGLWTIDDLADDGRLLLSRATGGTSQETSLWDPAKKALTPIAGQGQREEHHAIFGAGAEIVIQTNESSDKRRLYRLDGQKLVPITPELPHDVQHFSIDRTRTRILYTVNEGGFTRLFAMDAKSHKPLALPKLPVADHIRPGATTPDGRFTTVSIDDGKGPPHAHVIDWKSSSVTAWHHPSTPEIDTSGFAKAEITSYPAKDGTKIPALVRRPAKCASDPCAVVIAFHGGPEGQSLPGFSVSGQAFVDAGFVFVEPNVRGSDGYGKAWLHADDGPKRLEVITDIEDASVWARKEFSASGKAPKLGIYGGSYGGYSSLIGMTMFAGAYDAGVDVVGISNLITFLENTAPYRRALRTSEYGDPEKDRDALVKLSPTTYVDRVKAPLLIIQGATDPRVPAGEAVQMHEALTARGVTSELMIFPDEGHGAQRRENQVLFLGHSIAFFEKQLLGKLPARDAVERGGEGPRATGLHQVPTGKNQALGAERAGQLAGVRRGRDAVDLAGDDDDARRVDRRPTSERAHHGVRALEGGVLGDLLVGRPDQPAAVACEVGDRRQWNDRDRERQLGLDRREQRRRIAAEAHPDDADARRAATAENAGKRAEIEHRLTEPFDRHARIAAGKERARAGRRAASPVSRQHGQRDVEPAAQELAHGPEALLELDLSAEVAVHDHDRRTPLPGDSIQASGRPLAVPVRQPLRRQLGQQRVELALPCEVDDLAAATEGPHGPRLDRRAPWLGKQRRIAVPIVGPVNGIQSFHTGGVTERLGRRSTTRRLAAGERGAIEDVVDAGGEPLNRSGDKARHDSNPSSLGAPCRNRPGSAP